MISFCIPGPPQGKGRARAMRTPKTGKVIMVTPEKTVAYEGLIAYTAKAAMAGAAPMQEAVRVDMFIGCPIPDSWSGKKQAAALAGRIIPKTKPDSDNVLKALADGCNGVVWRDDSQIADVFIRKRYAAAPCLRVSVSEIVGAA